VLHAVTEMFDDFYYRIIWQSSRTEACGLANNISILKFIFSFCSWYDILFKINRGSKKL
jgi:hypothetical protein